MLVAAQMCAYPVNSGGRRRGSPAPMAIQDPHGRRCRRPSRKRSGDQGARILTTAPGLLCALFGLVIAGPASAFFGGDGYRDLERAVAGLSKELVEQGALVGKRVFVSPRYFFEEGNQCRRRPRFAEALRGRFNTELSELGVQVVLPAGDEKGATDLGVRWRVRSEGKALALTATITKLTDGGPELDASVKGLVRSYDPELLDPDLDSLGLEAVCGLEEEVDGSFLNVLRFDDFAVDGVLDSDGLRRYLEDFWLRPAFAQSRSFTLVEVPSGAGWSGGELRVRASVGSGHVTISLHVLDDRGVQAASTTIDFPGRLLPRELLRELSRREFRDCTGICPLLVEVPSGTFDMGSPRSEAGRFDDEGPVRRLTIPEPFAVGVYEITRGEFAAFVRATRYSVGACRRWMDGRWEESSFVSWENAWEGPEPARPDRHPVVCVSWEDARAYVKWLSEETGEAYRLPSESEWEHAARAATSSARHWGEGESGQCRHANGADETFRRGRHGAPDASIASCDDDHEETAPVGSFAPNRYGLHDVLGNVWEWTEDCWNARHDARASNDGSARERGRCEERVIRGGSWRHAPEVLRSAVRAGTKKQSRTLDIGFRVARTL